MLPDNVRSLVIVRLPSGDYQASLNTLDMPMATFNVHIDDTAVGALRKVCNNGKRTLPPLPIPLPVQTT